MIQISNPSPVSEIHCCAWCSLLPELESVLLAALTFGAAPGKHPNVSVAIPAMEDCTLPSEWSQMNVVVFKK